LDFNLRKVPVKCYSWNIALYGAETWTLQKVDQKYLESFEMWCWRRMDITWTDHVRNKDMLHRVKVERNFLHTIKRRNANCIGRVLCRNCLLKHITEGKIDGMIKVRERQGSRCAQLVDDHKEKRGYCKLKEEVLDLTLWRTCFGRGCGPVIMQAV
jgi:hypothetical protein